MTAKAIKIEKTEDFIHALQDEPSLWEVVSPIYKEKSKKLQSLAKLGEMFGMQGKHIFIFF